MEKQTIVVWFSCGAASAVAAKKVTEIYGEQYIIRIVNNPIANEHPDNLRFLKDVEKWVGIPIEYAINKNYPTCNVKDVFDERGVMSAINYAPCTEELKMKARRQWEEENTFDWLVMGFTAEEKGRADRFKKYERSNFYPVLVSEGITKNDCFKILAEAGIELPEIYKLGYPNANCIGCVKATSPTYWNLVRRTFPEVFKERAEQSEAIGCRLVRVKNKRIFLSELDPEAKGAKLKHTAIECGIFCETK